MTTALLEFITDLKDHPLRTIGEVLAWPALCVAIVGLAALYHAFTA